MVFSWHRAESVSHQLIEAYPSKGPYIVVSFNLQWSYFTTKEKFCLAKQAGNLVIYRGEEKRLCYIVDE